MTTTTAQPHRLQASRAKGSRLPDGAIRVTRPSRFGNPFTLSSAIDMGFARHGDVDQARQAAVAAFREWLAGNRDMWQSDEADHRRERILTDIRQLRGRDLACYCPTTAQHCHAEVLIEWANLPEEQLATRIQRARDRVNNHRTWRGEKKL